MKDGFLSPNKKILEETKMKKLISFVLAAVLCFGMATTVLAAPSPEVDSPIIDNIDGSPVVQPENLGNSSAEISKIEASFTSGEISQEVYEELLEDIAILESETDTPEKQELLNTFVTKSGKNVKKFVKTVAIYIDADVDSVNGTWVDMTDALLEKGIQVKDGMQLVVTHQRTNDAVWENIQVDIRGNRAYGKFYSLSTVSVMEVELDDYVPPVDDDDVDDDDVAPVSPKTADNSMTLYVMMLAMAACGAVVFKARKAK